MSENEKWVIGGLIYALVSLLWCAREAHRRQIPVSTLSLVAVALAPVWLPPAILGWIALKLMISAIVALVFD